MDPSTAAGSSAIVNRPSKEVSESLDLEPNHRSIRSARTVPRTLNAKKEGKCTKSTMQKARSDSKEQPNLENKPAQRRVRPQACNKIAKAIVQMVQKG